MAKGLSSFNSITGTIRNADGSPAQHLTIKAYSKTLISENLLGTAVTDTKGVYKINYSAGILAQSFFIKIYDETGKTFRGQSPAITSKNGTVTIDFTFSSATGNNVISGTIYNEADNPKQNAYVELYEKKLGSLGAPWGASGTDADGFYSITYTASQQSVTAADFFIRVYSDQNKTNVLGESPAYYGIPLSYTINYRIGGEHHKESSAFNALHNVITSLLNGKNITQLQPDDITILAGKTGADAGKIVNLSVAHQLAEQLDVNKDFLPDMLNGLLSQNFPQDKNSLLLTKSSAIRNGIQQGIDDNIISYKSQQQIDDTINTLNAKATEYVLKGTDARNVSFQNMIKAVLPSDNQQTAFVQTWFAHEDEPEKFWDALGTQTGFDAATVDNVKNIFTLNQLTGNETGLTVSLFAESQTDNELKDLTGFAKFTKDNWKTRITDVVNGSLFSGFPDWVTGETNEEKIESYAAYLYNLINSFFATRVFAKRMAADTNDAFGNKNDLTTFFSNNPEFDLKTNQPATLFDAANLDGISDKESTKKSLLAINRLLKPAGEYAAASRLSIDGLNSSNAIVKKYSLPKFVETFSADLGEETAKSIYKKAKQVDNRTTAVAVGIKTRNDIPLYAIDSNAEGGYATSPDYESMFGDNMLCDCEECQSVHSPAAYFVDVLKFLDDNSNEAFNELTVNRRPDLKQIFLTCQNTNTPLPYIDLVNEILEDAVTGTSSVYQTTNTPEELMAYPEHINLAAYTILKSANYSFDLPFNLALTQTRLLLKKLLIQRYELMELFFGKKGNNKYTDPYIAAEYLQLSVDELQIINGTVPVPEIEMNNVSDFLQQTGLTYIEMLQLLECYFINPLVDENNPGSGRTITIVSSDTQDPETCNIGKLIFNGAESALPKVNRFIRLWKKLGWDILDVDRAFSAFNIKSIDKIDNVLIVFLSHIARIKSTLGLSIPAILALWSDVDTGIYTDHTAEGQPLIMNLYQKLFQNKQTTNPLDASFNDPKKLNGTLSQKVKTITTALSISQVDFESLKALTDDTLTLANLSILFRYVTLAKTLRLSIDDLKSLVNITAIDPFDNLAVTVKALMFIDAFSFIKSSGYSLSDLFVLLGKTAVVPETTDTKQVSDIFITLRDGLQKIEQLYPDASTDTDQANNKLQNQKSFIADTLSAVFKTKSGLVTVLLNGVEKPAGDPTPPPVTAFINPEFINSSGAVYSVSDSGEITWLFPDLVTAYTNLKNIWNRISGLLTKFKITTDEFIHLQQEHDNLGLTGIWNLQYANPGTIYISFENLYNIIRFRNALANITADWYLLFDNTKGNDNNAKKDFINSLVSLTGIDQSTVMFLLDNEQQPDIDVNSKGVLNFTFPADYKNGAALLNVIRCAMPPAFPGTAARSLFEFLKWPIDDASVQLATGILKSKYDEITWLDVIKPISDQLRMLKRDALASYLINKPDSKWKNTDGLYAYFLIDVEMDACMATSRIKQAISSVQLFVDRCLMNLEYPLSLPEDFSTQWNTWRKQYRVWEANRKIFLYPENWIEPELRDDKTPFFEDLESALRQNDITDDTATYAVLSYLEKLDTVANLEMVGLFPDEETHIVHVIGRTRNIPHQYFYRKQENNIWSAWEKMDVDIEGDHILPVVWNNRLMVFWGVFTEKQDSSGSTTITNPSNANGGDLTMTSPCPVKYLEMKLAWSEYKNGKWSGKKASKDTILINKRMTVVDHRDGDTKKYNIFPDLDHCLISSAILDDKLIISISNWADEINLLTNRYINTEFRFNENSKYAEVFEKDVYLNLATPPGTRGEKMSIYEYDKDSLSFYIQALFINPSSNENSIANLIFGNTPGTFKILACNHEIGKEKSLILFYNDEQNNFYEHSFERIIVPHPNEPPTSSNNVLNRTTSPNPAITEYSNQLQVSNNENKSANNNTTHTSTESIHSEKFYTFQTFYHPYSNEFIKIINTEGIAVLYRPESKKSKNLYPNEIQNVSPIQLITEADYQPGDNVVTQSSYKEVDFKLSGSYSIYNWEIFFHIPLLIATQLSQNQKFEEARNWFHYIFDPTESSSSDTGAKRFWRTQSFKKEIDNNIITIDQLITDADYVSDLQTQLTNWEQNAFNPHAVARFRISAYMRCTIMKYINNLIAWGDNLFQRDTIESINEATLLYILAANLLGNKPQQIPPRAILVEKSYNNLEISLDSFGDAKVAIESFISSSDASNDSSDGQLLMPIFCVPKNDVLLGYWDTIADRLFKIRHCMNIEGIVRQLPLFEPPIDPGLLVRATAAGLDLSEILNDVNISLPAYRFQVMLQKANELCNDVRALGSALLSVLEKQDVEKLALLRSTHEIQMLNAVRDMKVKQRDEAQENLDALNASRKVTEERQLYYQNNASSYLNASEKQYFDATNAAIGIHEVLEMKNYLASMAALTPNLKIGSGFTIGTTFGGDNLKGAEAFATNALQSVASLLRLQAETANMKGGYDRRMDEWKFQTKSADLELQQIDKQITAAEIRLAIAEKDLENHDLQIEQSKEVDDYMKSKFTNAELYDWMVGQISSVYFQTYQLAYSTAKKAEKCMQYELGIENTSFVQFGYWDSLKKGLLSGEKLQYDLRRLENFYLEQNTRDFEITKHISLALINPLAILQLKETGNCEFMLSEELFDLDFPAHYRRRIKSVSISIPCIAGPYTSVNATLKLTRGEYRINTEAGNGYPKSTSDDTRFRESIIGVTAIATSTAQMDSGMFELNFRDERYLPFEGTGIASTWSLRLMEDVALRQFNYETISDIIIHLRYTAKEGDDTFKAAAVDNLKSVIQDASTLVPLSILFDVKHEFADEWHTFVNTTTDNAELQLSISKDRLPFFAANKNVEITNVQLFAKKKDIQDKSDIPFDTDSKITYNDTYNLFMGSSSITSQDDNFTFNLTMTKSEVVKLDELFLVLTYKLS